MSILKCCLFFFRIITDFINAIQGVLIFVILVVLRKKVLRGLSEIKFAGFSFPQKWKTLHDVECMETDEEESHLSNGTNTSI